MDETVLKDRWRVEKINFLSLILVSNSPIHTNPNTHWVRKGKVGMGVNPAQDQTIEGKT